MSYSLRATFQCDVCLKTVRMLTHGWLPSIANFRPSGWEVTDERVACSEHVDPRPGVTIYETDDDGRLREVARGAA